MAQIQNIKYLLRSISNLGQKKECPYCNENNLQKIDGKYLFTSLLKCGNCGLAHRHPKDDEKFLRNFYQKEYNIDTAMMTKLPTDKEIETLTKENFPQLRSYNQYIRSLSAKSNLKLLDYGCSWGYNVFKLINAGIDAYGYELSVPRANYGMDKLGVTIYTNEKSIPTHFDVVFSSHVIEHLSNIKTFIEFSQKTLTKDGIFIAFCPNGTEDYKLREPSIYHLGWGAVHPNYLTVEFGKFAFKNNPYLILTGDWDFNSNEIEKWDGISQVVGPRVDGKELLIIAKPNVILAPGSH